MASDSADISGEVRDGIFAAVLAELVERGIDELRIEHVADRAGVDLSLIRARWHDHRVLLMDAMLTLARQSAPAPHTGTLRGDLEAVAASVAQLSDTDMGRRWFHRLLPRGIDADLSEVIADFWSAQFAFIEPVLQRAAASGVLRAGLDPREAVRMFAAALYYDVIFADAPVRPQYAAQVLDVFLYGVLADNVHDAVFREDFEAREHARALLRATTDAMIDPQALIEAVRDLDGHVVDFSFRELNPAACEYFDRPRAELIGASLVTALPDITSAGLLARFVHCIDSGEPLIVDDLPYPSRRFDQIRWFDLRVARAGADWLSMVWRDVTDQHLVREAQRKQAETGALYRSVIENSGIATGLTTPDGSYVMVNQALCDWLGYDAETLLTKTWKAIAVPSADRVDSGEQADATLIEDLLADRVKNYQSERQFIHADGHLVRGILTLCCLRDQSGQPEYLLGQAVAMSGKVESPIQR